MATKVYRGQTITGTIDLRLQSSSNPNATNPFVIPGGSTIIIKFPGQSSTVSVSLAGGEVTIVSSSLSTISFVVSATKSALLALSVGTAMASVDVIVTDPSNNVTIFEQAAVLQILDPANP